MLVKRRGGSVDFNAASTQILESIHLEGSYQTIVFLGHGYGNYIIAKILVDDKIQNLPDNVKTHRREIKESTVAAISFSSPIALSQRSNVREWTARELQLPLTSLTFDPIPKSPLPWKDFRKAAQEEGFALLTVLERPLPQSWDHLGTSSQGERSTESKPVESVDTSPAAKPDEK